MDNIDYVEEVKGMIQEIFRGPIIKEPINFTTSQGDKFVACGRDIQFIKNDGIKYLFGAAFWHQYPAKEIYDHIKPRYEKCLEAKKTPKLVWAEGREGHHNASTSMGFVELFRTSEDYPKFTSYLNIEKHGHLEIPFSCEKSEEDYLNEAKVYFEQCVEQEEKKSTYDISSADVRKALEGHEDSELFGEHGLLASTMKSVKALEEIEAIVINCCNSGSKLYMIRKVLEGRKNETKK